MAILADRAAAAPGVDHVMVIDEINRANLPKVFGELLFLSDCKARAGYYYQMLAYCTALDLREGVLIYCLADGAPPERAVEVVHTNTTLYTVPIDLTVTAPLSIWRSPISPTGSQDDPWEC